MKFLKSLFRILFSKEQVPSAYEFHNFNTGHCYVDYVALDKKGEKEGYTKIPLYRKKDLLAYLLQENCTEIAKNKINNCFLKT